MRETGVGIYDPLFFIGVVENNIDERLEGRVQVRAFGVHGTNDQVPTESLPWATLIHGSYDPNAPVPPVNSFVFGFFIDGRDAQQPMILGLIPTQMTDVINPAVTGWGRIPEKNAELLSKGSRPEDYGQPANSKLSRGEYIDETYVLAQEVGRVKDIQVARSSDNEEAMTFNEPAPAYNAQYPYNRVIETANHSIELDDTPGAERVTIWHGSGSYVSVDVRGTTVHKSVSDKYEINEKHQHVYIGGKNFVTIEGDSRVLVKGNKVEEIVGDYVQVIRGNHIVSCAGQMNFNASDEVQMRGAKIRVEANVEGINVKAAKNVKVETGEFLHVKSGATAIIEAADAINVNAKGDNVNIQAGADLNVKSDRTYITATGALDLYGGHVKIGGGSKVSINASLVAIDDIIQLAESSSVAPETAGDAAESEPAESTEMPEPASKSASTTSQVNTPSMGQSGYSSRDEGEQSSQFDTNENNSPSQGEDIPPAVGRSSPPGSPLTSAQEDLAWSSLEEKERSRRIAAGLPEKFSESERKTLKAIMAAEGGDQAANLAVVLNRSYQAKAPVDQIVMADKQFTPATSYLQGYRDKIAGVDSEGFDRFIGAYTSPATTSFSDAVNRYQTVPGYDSINYFVGRGLSVQYGTVKYEAGNTYSAGPGGNYFATGGSKNLERLNTYLSRNNLA